MSTPISELRSRKAQQINPLPEVPITSTQVEQNIPVRDDDIVNDILEELGESPGNNDSDMNAEMYRRSMDESQVPPPKKQVSFSDQDEELIINTNNQNLSTDEIAQQQLRTQGGFLSNYLDMSGFLGTCINILKSSVIVFLIILLLSMSSVNKRLFSMMPQFLLESGEINIYGNMIKALIGAVLFSLINYFL